MENYTNKILYRVSGRHHHLDCDITDLKGKEALEVEKATTYSVPDDEVEAETSTGNISLKEAVLKVLNLIVEDPRNPELVGRRALILGHLLNRSMTQRDLAMVLHVSPATVNSELNTIKRKIAEIAANPQKR